MSCYASEDMVCLNVIRRSWLLKMIKFVWIVEVAWKFVRMLQAEWKEGNIGMKWYWYIFLYNISFFTQSNNFYFYFFLLSFIDTKYLCKYEMEESSLREENVRLQRKLLLEMERREQLSRQLSESESSLEMDDER